MNAREECRDISQINLPAKLQVLDKKVCLKGHRVSGSFAKNTEEEAKEKQQVKL